MPNWKKLIVSGSDANLNSLNVTTSITGSDVKIDDWGSISGSLANLTDTTPDGSGTANYITKWSDSDSLTDSSISDDGSTINLFANTTGNTGVVNIYGEGGVPPTLQVSSRTNRAKLKIADNDTAINIIAEDSIGSFGFGSTSSATNNLSILSSGNVGIGTSSPDRSLHVRDSAIVITKLEGTNQGSLLDLVNSNASQTYNGLRFTQGTTSKMAITHIADGTTKGYIQIGNNWSTGSEILVVDGRTSNVGIGTTSPGYKLQVNDGNVAITGGTTSTLFMNITTNQLYGDVNGVVILKANNNLRLNTNGAERVRIIDNGNVGIGTTAPSHLLTLETASSPGIKIKDTTQGATLLAFSQDSNSHIGTYSSHPLVLDTNSTERMRIDQTGNVGIGTTTPSAKLEVYSSGSTVFEVNGSQGQLFSITDSLSGSLFSVSDISGTPLFEVESDSTVTLGDYNTNTLVVTGSLVGIGTSSPTDKLHIDFADAPDKLLITLNGANKARIDGYGNIVAYGSLTSYGNILQGGGGMFRYRGGYDTQLIGHRFENYTGAFTGTSGDQTMMSIVPTINQSSTAGYTGIKLNVAEDATGSGTKNLLDLQVDGASKFSVNNLGTVNLSGDLTVDGIITAQEFHTEFVSASIIYQSGSTKFGDTTDDIHDFTGSLRVTGSGEHYFTDGKLVVGSTTSNYKFGVTGGHLGVSNGGNIYIGGFGADAVIGYMGNESGVFALRSDGNRDVSIGSGTVNNSIFIEGSNGNVGIGTTIPSGPLHVYNGTSERLLISGDVSIKGATDLQIDGTSRRVSFNSGTGTVRTSTANSLFLATNNTTAVTVNALQKIQFNAYGSGNITGSLAATLGVDSSGNIIEFSGGGGGSVSAITSGADTRVAYFNGTDSLEGSANFTWDDSKLTLNKATIGEYLRVGSGAIRELKFSTYNTTSDHAGHKIDASSSNGEIAFATGGSARMYIGNTGNIGIGAAPSTSKKLFVNGSASVGGEMFFSHFDNISNASRMRDDLTLWFGTNRQLGIKYNSTEDQLQFVSGSSAKMVMDPNGNIGIGTTSPAYKLDVSGDIRSTSQVRANTNLVAGGYIDVTGIINHRDDIRVLNKLATNWITWATRDTSGPETVINLSNVKDAVFSGNVGIGTTSPSYKFTAYGNSADSEIVASFGSANDQNEYTAIGLSGFIASNGATKAGLALKRTATYGTGELHFLNNNTLDNSDMTLSDSKMMINGAGNVGIGIGVPSAVGGTAKLTINSNDAPVSIVNGTTDGMYIRRFDGANGHYQLQTTVAAGNSGTLSLQTYGGDVGIGTTSPGAKLQVDSGATNVTSIFKSSDNQAWISIQDDDSGTYGALIGTDTDAGNDFVIANQSAQKTFVINSGNVGIGTTDPAYKLDVNGDIQNNGILRRGGNVFIKSTGSETMIGPAGSGIISFHNSATMTAGDETVRIDANGNLLLNNTSAGARLDIREDTNYAIRAEDATGHYFRVNTGGDVDMRGDLVVQGTITAQQFHSEFVSASIIYDSGSTKFGDTSDDTHSFTGSLDVSGSIESFGELTFTNTTANSINSIVNLTLNADSDSNSGDAYRNIIFANRGSEKARFDVDGNLGIGTTSPAGKLMVRDDSAGNPTRLIVSNGGTVQSGTTARLSFYEGTSEKGYIERRRDGSGKIAFVTPADDNPFVWENPTGEIMRINNSNVGIGTTSPTVKFHVLGNPNSKGVLGRMEGSSTLGALIQYDRGSSYNWTAGIGGANATAGIPASYFGISETTNTPRFVIAHTTGNVGIGTTNPSYKLQVGNAGALADSIRLGSYDAVKDTRQYIGYTRQDTGLFETSTSGNTPSSVLPGVSGIRIVNTEGSVLSTKADQSIQLLTHIYNGSSRVALHANYDGKVGIGTTSPAKTLDVNGDVYINSNYPSNAAASDLTIGKTTTGDHGLTIVTGATNTAGIFFADNNNNDAGRIKYQHSNNSMRFETDRAERMRISSTGNVGIGTTAPKQLFHVHGGSTAGSVTKAVIGGTGGNGESYLYLAEHFSGDNVNYGFSFVTDGNSSNNLLIKRHSNSTSGVTVLTINRDNSDASFSGALQVGSNLDVNGTSLTLSSAAITYQNNNDVDTGTETIATVVKANHDAAFFDYVVKNGTNLRAGTVMAVHDGTNVEFTDNSTKDIGDTSGVTFSVDISGTDLRLRATTTSDNWIIKTLVKSI